MRAGVVMLALACAVLDGCGRRSEAPTAPAAAARADPDFRAPPTIVSAARDGAGMIALHGRAQPGAVVVLRSPDGATLAANAGPDGAWDLRLGPVRSPRAFALAADEPGRIVRGEGAVLVAPAPFAPVVMMRGGAPALPVSMPGAGFRWSSVDTDPGGGAAVSGFAAPGVTLRLAIDGVVQGEGAADATGRFGILWLGGPAPAGPHAITVSTPAGAWSTPVTFGPADLAGRPVRIASESGGWRIDWAPPGGGAQTLHLLAPEAVTEAGR